MGLVVEKARPYSSPTSEKQIQEYIYLNKRQPCKPQVPFRMTASLQGKGKQENPKILSEFLYSLNFLSASCTMF